MTSTSGTKTLLLYTYKYSLCSHIRTPFCCIYVHIDIAACQQFTSRNAAEETASCVNPSFVSYYAIFQFVPFIISSYHNQRPCNSLVYAFYFDTTSEALNFTPSLYTTLYCRSTNFINNLLQILLIQIDDTLVITFHFHNAMITSKYSFS